MRHSKIMIHNIHKSPKFYFQTALVVFSVFIFPKTNLKPVILVLTVGIVKYYSLTVLSHPFKNATFDIFTEQKNFTLVHSVQSARTKSLLTKLAMSVHSSATFCATGAWGDKPIGRVRVKWKILKDLFLLKTF